MQKIRTIFLIVTFFALGLFAVFYFKSRLISEFNHPKDMQICAYINGSPVLVKELKIQMEKHQTEVFRYYTQKKGLQYSRDFWHKKVNGRAPIEDLRQKAFEAVKKYKVQLLLMKKHGLLKSVEYKDLLDDMQKENSLRQDNIKKGQPVYGLSKFTFEVYLDYIISKHIQDMLNNYEEWTHKPTAEEINKFINSSQNKISPQNSMQEYIRYKYEEYVQTSVDDADTVILYDVFNKVLLE